ncbi:MAG: AAA family ATPase [Bacteroidota bacterium]|nr:AAA family ATPase [Bacteroidota bacterium]
MESDLQLIIVRGTPGAGKSSLGRRLKKRFPSGALIEIDNFRGMLNNVNWDDEQQHFIALEAAAASAIIFNRSGFEPVIVVDMFMPYKLKFFLEKVNVRNYKIISLLVNENVLEKRLTERKEGFKDVAKGNSLNKMILEHSIENEIRIETSEIDKNAVLEIALRKLNT